MNDIAPRHTGGCQCGAVRFALAADPAPATICHCRICQKATGNFFAPLAGARRADLTWTRGAPAFFASSDIVERGFCANCGTPLTFAYVDGDAIELAVGAFDRPEALRVVEQIWTSARLAAFDGLHTLPARREDEPGYEGAVASAAATNHQHPDHDTEGWTPRPCRRG